MKKKPKVCYWKERIVGGAMAWVASDGSTSLTSSHPLAEYYDFCPYCGNPILVVR